jgi:ornithine cyclodeaminase/alanine dehydrogenase-like protein (mu-crystallin family)
MNTPCNRPTGTLILTRRDVAALLSLEECIAAVERAFRLHGEGAAALPGILGIHARDGGFHIKAGILEAGRSYFAAKTNANFPQNPRRFSLPTIQGIVLVCDAENGVPLAVMDSIEITILRTGAATAVAAKHLARLGSRAATICGCGIQGRVQLRALRRVLPIEQAFAFDLDANAAARFSSEMAQELGIDVKAVSHLPEATAKSDVCVTCTTSTVAFLFREQVRPGTFIAAVGADNPEKHEISPALMAGSKVVADILEQSATIGDLHHALDAGVLQRSDAYAELGEIVAGKKPGRTNADEITILDSTGMALQDIAAAVAVYEKAIQSGSGAIVNFAS